MKLPEKNNHLIFLKIGFKPTVIGVLKLRSVLTANRADVDYYSPG